MFFHRHSRRGSWNGEISITKTLPVTSEFFTSLKQQRVDKPHYLSKHEVHINTLRSPQKLFACNHRRYIWGKRGQHLMRGTMCRLLRISRKYSAPNPPVTSPLGFWGVVLKPSCLSYNHHHFGRSWIEDCWLPPELQLQLQPTPAVPATFAPWTTHRQLLY